MMNHNPVLQLEPLDELKFSSAPLARLKRVNRSTCGLFRSHKGGELGPQDSFLKLSNTLRLSLGGRNHTTVRRRDAKLRQLALVGGKTTLELIDNTRKTKMLNEITMAVIALALLILTIKI